MSCGGCGKSSCRGCKDIKVVLPAGVGISSITDNGDGTWTITYTDDSTEIIDTPGAIPNDAWVELDETDMSAIAFTGSATHNTTTIDLRYKILNEDTVVIKGHVTLNATITAIGNSINNNFRFPPFGSSNWFVGTKIFVPVAQRVPISIYTTTITDLPNQKGNVIISTSSSENLISIGETNLQLANGTYTFNIHFEVICEIV